MSEEIEDKKDKKEKKKRKSLLSNIKVFRKRSSNTETETKVDNLDKYNQLIMAKLMSIGFNIIQFVSNSLILNQALYNIFRFYKLSTPNRVNVIEMLKIQIVSEGNDNLKLDEDLLLNNNLEKYKNIKNEEPNNNVKSEVENENNNIKKDLNLNNEDKKEEIKATEMKDINTENKIIENMEETKKD